MNNIPMHQLKSRVNTGMEMEYFALENKIEETETLGAHRDDHYLFFLLGDGTASLMIDFNEMHFKEHSLFYILPGQVHHRIENNKAYGWYLAVDTALIPPDYRNVFEGRLLLQQPIVLDEQLYGQCNQLLNLLYTKYRDNAADGFHLPVVYSLLHAFIGITASRYNKENEPGGKASRPVELAQQFKQLLTQHLVAHKNPSAYADLMNVSEGYLNEVLKKITGLSVSQLILHEVMLEAKRLLYYSKLNVKEIAHALGYQDHTYFSRLFKKQEDITPLAFRAGYLK